MPSKYVKVAREATSSKDSEVQQSNNSPSAETQRVKMFGASDNTVASITLPPPDPPPIRTADNQAEIFNKDHYGRARPWTEYPTGYPGFSAFVSVNHDKFTTLFWRFEILSDPNPLYLEGKLFQGRPSYFFHKRAADGLLDFISSTRIAVTVTILSSLIASIFFIGATHGMYWVKTPNAKLGMLSSLAVAFAGSLALFTNARKRDAFAAKVAYTAVLMVFFGRNFTAALETSTSTAFGPTTLLTFTQTTLETSTVTALSTVIETVSSQNLQTTPTGSLVASQTSSTPLSPSSTSKTSGGLSQDQKIGLGVGLGVGISAVLVGLVLFLNRRKLKRKPPLVIEPIHQGLY